MKVDEGLLGGVRGCPRWAALGAALSQCCQGRIAWTPAGGLLSPGIPCDGQRLVDFSVLELNFAPSWIILLVVTL